MAIQPPPLTCSILQNHTNIEALLTHDFKAPTNLQKKQGFNTCSFIPLVPRLQSLDSTCKSQLDLHTLQYTICRIVQTHISDKHYTKLHTGLLYSSVEVLKGSQGHTTPYWPTGPTQHSYHNMAYGSHHTHATYRTEQ